MTDIFDTQKRSEIMSKIRGKNTKPEKVVFRYLKTKKIYYQKHYRTKQGIALDVAIPRKKLAVFIDGDFWHGRNIEKLIGRRGSEDFWVKKLEKNLERDSQQVKTLTEHGWLVLRVWESELMKASSQASALYRIQVFLQK